LNRKKIAILFELNMGSILYRLKRYNEAISYYDKVLERDAESLDALVNKGNALNHLASEGHALYRLKRFDEAISYYDKVLERDAEFLDALISKGHALNNLKRFDEANSYYDKALKQTTGYSLLSSSSSAHM